MDIDIVYEPCKRYSFLIALPTACSIAYLVGIGLCLPDVSVLLFIFIVMGIISCVLTKVMYDAMNILIWFGGDGIRIVGDRHRRYWYTPWENISYAYFVRSYNGYKVLILSCNKLEKQERKRLVRTWNWKSGEHTVVVDSTIIFCVNFGKNAKEVESLIANKIPNVVNEYG